MRLVPRPPVPSLGCPLNLHGSINPLACQCCHPPALQLWLPTWARIHLCPTATATGTPARTTALYCSHTAPCAQLRLGYHGSGHLDHLVTSSNLGRQHAHRDHFDHLVTSPNPGRPYAPRPDSGPDSDATVIPCESPQTGFPCDSPQTGSTEAQYIFAERLRSPYLVPEKSCARRFLQHWQLTPH